MKILIQRCSRAAVYVDEKCVGAIQHGLLLFIGIEKHDDQSALNKMAAKVLTLRIFPDGENKMNLNVGDVGGGVLVVSQFTLAADTRKGSRPGFSGAASPNHAKDIYDKFISLLEKTHPNVKTGRFGADMKVELINDGPATFLLNT